MPLSHDLETDCRRYVDLVNGPTNGWEQCLDEEYGQSHQLLWALVKAYDHKSVNDELDRQFAIYDAKPNKGEPS